MRGRRLVRTVPSQAEKSPIEVVASLWIHPGRVAEFEAYEHEATRIMQKYGGVVRNVVRNGDATHSSDGPPFEVHVLRFPSLEAFQSYRADPELAVLAAERNAAISRTEVSIGETTRETRAARGKQGAEAQ